jgi:hypothetical protein
VTNGPITEQQPPAGTSQNPAKRSDSGSRRTWLWFGSILGAVVVLIGLVWLAGGFERRTDLRTVVGPGTTIETGPYEFTFDSATVQKKQTFSDEPVWEVVVVGSGRVTGDEALAPSSLNWFFSVRDPASGLVREPERQSFGPVDRTSGGSFFTPGLALIPYRLTFELPADIAQPSTVELAVWELEYRDTSLLQIGDLTWARADGYYWYEGLPMTRLADELE